MRRAFTFDFDKISDDQSNNTSLIIKTTNNCSSKSTEYLIEINLQYINKKLNCLVEKLKNQNQECDLDKGFELLILDNLVFVRTVSGYFTVFAVRRIM